MRKSRSKRFLFVRIQDNIYVEDQRTMKLVYTVACFLPDNRALDKHRLNYVGLLSHEQKHFCLLILIV